MHGAILGDIIGSSYEFDRGDKKEFELFGRRARFTDGFVMTVAVAEALLKAETDAEVPAICQLRKRFRQEGVGGGMALRFHGANQRGGQGHGKEGKAMRCLIPAGLQSGDFLPLYNTGPGHATVRGTVPLFGRPVYRGCPSVPVPRCRIPQSCRRSGRKPICG